MAASTTGEVMRSHLEGAVRPGEQTAAHIHRRSAVRRRISPRAGRALEILGHAIDYLSDEYMYAGGGSPAASKGQIEAIQLLMAVNRRIYLECPEVPTWKQRCLEWLHLHSA